MKFAHASYPLCRRQPAERKPALPSRPSEAVSCSSAAVTRPAPSSGLGDQADSPKKRTCSLQPHGNFDAGSRSRDTIVRAVLDASSSSRPLPLPKSAVDPDVESSELAELRATIVSLKCEKAHLMLQNSTLQDRLKKVEEPGFEASLFTEEMWAYYTGLPSKSHFEKLLTYIEPHCHTIYSAWATGTPRGPQRQLSPREEFLLVLVRLRLGLQEQDLQYRFKLSSVGRVSKIFTAWMPAFLARILSPVLMPWPSRKKVQKNMPPAFKALKKYRKVRIILDCSEFEMEAPSSLALNAMSYSDYKGRTTVKVLFGVTPDGYVSFVSKAYGGAISDNSLTMKSGVLEKCDAGDKIMADKGFTLSNAELQPRGLATVLPPFRQGSAQFTLSLHIRGSRGNKRDCKSQDRGGKLHHEDTVLPFTSSAIDSIIRQAGQCNCESLCSADESACANQVAHCSVIMRLDFSVLLSCFQVLFFFKVRSDSFLSSHITSRNLIIPKSTVKLFKYLSKYNMQNI